MFLALHLLNNRGRLRKTRFFTGFAATLLLMEETVASYEEGLDAYQMRPRAVSEDEKVWLREAFRDLPRNSLVFEIGSGTAERSDYLESLGYTVQRSDVAESFLRFLHARDYQLKPVLFDLSSDEPPLAHCFFASAVLLHFSQQETGPILEKLRKKLLPGGRLVATWKEGQGEGLEERDGLAPRFFSYQSEESLKALFKEWRSVSIKRSEAGDTVWLQVIAFK